jgi:CHAT domain-containing protein/Tfp pilus assembly protein PilF
MLTALVLLAVPLCLPKVARADDAAECNAAWDEGEALRQRGEYSAAAKSYERALQLAPQVFGPEDENTIAIVNNLAIIYWKMSQYARAEPLYQRCLKIEEAKLGPNDTAVADTLNNLGLVYVDMGHYAQAEPLYQRSLRIRQAKLGPNDTAVADSLNNLAMLYWKVGQYARAEPLDQQALKIRESQLGSDHLSVADSLNNLAVLYVDMGQYGKAEPLYRRSLKITEARLGGEHPSVAETLNNLANLYKETGQYAQAEPLYQRSLKIWQAKLGPDHLLIAMSLHNLAALYQLMGQYGRAEPLYQQSIKITEFRLGPDHPDVAKSLSNLAVMYKDIGQYDKAEPLLLRSIKICELKLGPNHPTLADSLDNVASLYDVMGQYDRAEPLYQRSIKIRETKLGPNHPDVAKSVNNLAGMYREMGQYAKAEPLYQRSYQILESQFGQDHPLLVTSLYNLMVLHAATGQWAKAVAETEQQRRIVRRHVARTLPILNEKEQLTFLRTQDEGYLHHALSLGLQRRSDAQIAERSAGWVLNGKAVAQEVLAQRTLLAAEGTDPALADLVKQLMTVRSQLASLVLIVPKAGKEAAYRQVLQTLDQQEQELSRRLGQASGLNTTGDPWVELPAVRKALAKDAVLIEVVRLGVANFKARGRDPCWLPPRYAAWLIPAAGQGQIAIVDLGEAAKIDAAVQAARKALEQAHETIRKEGEAKAENQLHDAMRDLTRLVLEPLEGHLGKARELVVSPDAALWLVPWGALPLADGKYAVEKYQIRYCISGRDLVGRAASAGQRATNPVLFANPDYDLGPAETAARTKDVLRDAAPAVYAFGGRGAGSLSSLPRVRRLPGTADEAAAIKPSVARYAKLDAVVYEDQYALKGVFEALHGPRVLVLCTHGFFLPDQETARKEGRPAAPAEPGARAPAVLTTEGKLLENPLLRCGLLLAGCNQPAGEGAEVGGDDGILTGLEIVGTDLRGTELVVLSACDTGLGQVRNGEGVAGLRQAFQLAGANAVVSTLWQIPDVETADVMNVFFAYLSQGQSKAEALRNAQLALIKARRADHAAAHPFYWAAFTLTGN